MANTVSFRHSPGGALPPRAKRWAPPGKVDQKFFIEALPGKAPPGKFFPGGPTLKMFEALPETPIIKKVVKKFGRDV
jgi:hypothetical protein